jgi:hypothetical protein
MDEKPLEKWSTEDLERYVESDRFKYAADRGKAKRILWQRYTAADRNVQRWTLALALGAFVVCLLTWFLI